jgi:hypothetical protein
MSEEKVARCTTCRSEFTDAELEGKKACPSCGSTGVPCDPRKDTQITINPHELRILTIWASNYAEAMTGDEGLSCQRSLKGILGNLSKQLPDTPLTLRAEVQELADGLGTEVEMVKEEKGVTTTETFKGTKPS